MITLACNLNTIKIVGDVEVFMHSENIETLLYLTHDDLSEFLRIGRINDIGSYIMFILQHHMIRIYGVATFIRPILKNSVKSS